jgi:hypothetical protein
MQPARSEGRVLRVEVEHGAIIADDEGRLWRVLEVSDEGVFLLMLPERRDIVHTRTLKWRDFVECGFDLKFP